MNNHNTKEPRPPRGIRLAACSIALVMAITTALLESAQGATVTPPPLSAVREQSFVPPAVFQAAGPKIASIQSTVDGYRAELGEPNNGNQPGPSRAAAARSIGMGAVPSPLLWGPRRSRSS